MNEEIAKTIEVLNQGGIILYPTDTIWGIGCAATNEKAAEKIYRIKKRQESKSMIILVSDESMLNKYVKSVPSIARDWMKKTETPLTIVYDEGIHLAKTVLDEKGGVAVRIPKDEFCTELIYKFGKPIVSTSANVSGEKTPQQFSDISSSIIAQVDYVVKWRTDDEANAKPSTIIKVKSNGELTIIRK